jgi:hypothetical protein
VGGDGGYYVGMHQQHRHRGEKKLDGSQRGHLRRHRLLQRPGRTDRPPADLRRHPAIPPVPHAHPPAHRSCPARPSSPARTTTMTPSSGPCAVPTAS